MKIQMTRKQSKEGPISRMIMLPESYLVATCMGRSLGPESAKSTSVHSLLVLCSTLLLVLVVALFLVLRTRGAWSSSYSYNSVSSK